MLNPKVRWNSRSRIRAARLAGTRKLRSEKKFSIDVSVLLYTFKQDSRVLWYAFVHHSYFMLHLASPSVDIVPSVKKMKWVKFGASQSPLCPGWPGECRPAAGCCPVAGIYLPSSSRARLGIKRLWNNVFRLSSTGSVYLMIYWMLCFLLNLRRKDKNILAPCTLVENNWFE